MDALNTSHRRILLVDHSRDERDMYAEWFRLKGYCTLQAATADDAYRLACELVPDVVITEIRLGGSVSGLELTKRLKGADETRALPVIVLSGFVFNSDSEAAAQAGCDLFVAKPCLPDELGIFVDGLLQAAPEHQHLNPHWSI